ncbi:hypothetical protein KL918_002151 [Ogataea parapolymorpha]|nr:hypothetical protein KL918_002151 [Ogataea parapolymorpha]KAG7871736.1 hypothetical protein KL916_003836 [Ogataea parapolymorpha]
MLNQSLADYMNAMTGHIYLSTHLPPHPTDLYNLIDVFGHGIEPATGALAKTTNLVYEDLLDSYARHDRPSNNATPGCAWWAPWTAFAAGKTAQGVVDLVLWPAGRRVKDQNGRICGANIDATIHRRAVGLNLLSSLVPGWLNKVAHSRDSSATA